MSSQALGPVYRSTADILDAHLPGLNAALEKLRQKILKKLAALPKVRDRFDRSWSDATTNVGRTRAVMATLLKVAQTIGEMGPIAGPDLQDTHAELLALLDLLRLLAWIEAQAKHYRDLAKTYGY